MHTLYIARNSFFDSGTDVMNQLPLLHEDYIEKECLSSNTSELCMGGVKPEHWMCWLRYFMVFFSLLS